MSVSRALKLTLIIALKTITKQQELADVSGGRMVTRDGVMFTTQKRHLATTLVLWTPMDHPLMAVSSLWAAGRPVLWCLCPPARDSVHLCMHPAITIWKPPQHPSTGKRMHLIHERVTKLEKWKKVVYFFPPLFYLEANFIVLLFDDSSSTVEFFNQFRSLSWCCHVFSSYFRCIFHEEVREVELVCF